MARSDTVGTAVFAAILIALGVFEIAGDAMGWANRGAWWYFQGAGLIPGGWFAARSRRTVTWADDAGLRLRGMFRTREVPWSQVRYIRARPDGRKWIVEAGLVDGTVKLPGTVGRPDRTRQFAADLTAVNPGEQWLAIGLDLTAVPAAEGSRQTPLLVTESLRYRANWGLPGMTGTDQPGAPLLCSSAATLAPGDSARAVIIPLTDAHMGEWRLLGQGDRLRLFEGPRVCGHAVVRWSEGTSLPVSSTDTDRFSAWANSSDDLPRPA
jgi:Bacterial PH domain